MIQITPLFPQGVGSGVLLHPSHKTLDICSKYMPDTTNNQGNTTSKDSYVLNHQELLAVKENLEGMLREFLYAAYSPSNKELEVYITQSWLNYTEEGEHHHIHSHDNSLLSGVVYLKVLPSDSIVFHRGDAVLPLNIPCEEYGVYNSDTWRFDDLKEGDVFLFPSTLVHSVDTVLKGGRVSLAFNSYVRGTIGSKEALTELIL